MGNNGEERDGSRSYARVSGQTPSQGWKGPGTRVHAAAIVGSAAGDREAPLV